MINEAGKACRFSVIGEVIKEDILIERSDGIEELKSRGFEHFKQQGTDNFYILKPLRAILKR